MLEGVLMGMVFLWSYAEFQLLGAKRAIANLHREYADLHHKYSELRRKSETVQTGERS